MIRALKGRGKVTVRLDDIMVDLTNSGQDGDFTADCLLIMKIKRPILFDFVPAGATGCIRKRPERKKKNNG